MCWLVMNDDFRQNEGRILKSLFTKSWKIWNRQSNSVRRNLFWPRNCIFYFRSVDAYLWFNIINWPVITVNVVLSLLLVLFLHFISFIYSSLICFVLCDKIYDLINLLCGARSPGIVYKYIILMVGSNFHFFLSIWRRSKVYITYNISKYYQLLN